MNVAVVDYGMGNLRSVEKALERVGATPVVTRDHAEIRAADRIVLPGVGAFPKAMAAIRELGLDELLRERVEAHVPVLGICLGHQLAAVALGGAVHPNPRGQQIGVLDVGWAPAAAADPLFGSVSSARVAVQWNNDIVTVPPTATQVLARAGTGELQAARFAHTVWGVQSHPEAGAEIVGEWAAKDRDSARERGVDVDEYVARGAAATDELRASWKPLATAFAAMSKEIPATW